MFFLFPFICLRISPEKNLFDEIIDVNFLSKKKTADAQKDNLREGEGEEPTYEQPPLSDEDAYNAAKQYVNQDLLSQLLAMEFSELYSIKALLYTDNNSIDAAVFHFILTPFSIKKKTI